MSIWRNDILLLVIIICAVALCSSVGGQALPLAFLALLFALAYRFPEASFIFVLLNGIVIGGFWPGSRKWLLAMAIGFGALSLQELLGWPGAS